MKRRVSVWFVLGLAACAADPAAPGSPSVSGESHFLSPCVETAECGATLSCLCGVCTVACDADAACETIAPGAVCGGSETCGEAPGGRVCEASPSPGDAGPDAAGPVCVLPQDGTCPPETLEVVLGVRIDVDRQCRGADFTEPLSCVTFMPGGSTAFFCVRRVADGALFGIPNGNCLPPGEFTFCDDEFFMPAWPLCPEVAAAGACEPRDLGLRLEPLPEADVSGSVQRIDLAPDTLLVEVLVEGRAETYTLRGPFATLDPAALEGLDQFGILVRDGNPGDFRLSLRGCDRDAFIAVDATRPLLERAWGPVDDLFDAGVRCAEGPCPREYALSWQEAVVPAGRSVDALATQIRAGHVTGCRGDATAPAHVEFVVLPRANVPTCAGAGPPGENTSAFTMTDDAGAWVVATEGMDVERTDEVVPTLDPTDAKHLTLTPVDPQAGLPTLHLRTALDLPADFTPPVTLRQRLTTPWHWNRVFELADATGLRIAAVAGDRSVAADPVGLTATTGAPLCRMPWDSGVQDLRPLTIQRVGDAPVTTAALGVTTEAGVRIDLRASGDYVNVCTTDTPNGWLDFVAVWE
jgi:hypothetical protein